MANFGKAKLIVAILLPLFVTTVGVCATTFGLLDKVSTDVNQLDHARNAQIVKSALAAEAKQLANLVSDNSYWDDAVRNVRSLVPNEQWINDTWGYSSAEGTNYNMLAIVEQAKPDALSAYIDGKPQQLSIKNFFKGSLEPLLLELQNSTNEASSKGIVLDTMDGFSVVAVAPIMPSTVDLKPESATPRYLVLAKRLSSDALQQISAQYVIKDLQLSAATNTDGGVVLTGPGGNLVAVATWEDNSPGAAAQNTVRTKTYSSLGLLALVMAALGCLCIKLFFTLGEREKRTRHGAFHDSLTGLKNRAGLVQELNTMLALPGNQISMAFVDLDGFKDVNDTYDHNVGDQLIQFIAEGMRQLDRDGGVLARAGGDEFVALYAGKNAAENARKFALDLIAFLDAPIELSGRFASVGASIGVCDGASGSIVESEILRRADVAMYHAKTSGKNRLSVYSPEIDLNRVTTLEISTGLRRIIANDEIELVYQPIVDAFTHKVQGVEVLARWPTTVEGNFPPDKFIPVAETSGLIDGLGETILRKACEQACRWPDMELSINISPVQLRNPNFVSRTLEIVKNSGMNPRQIELEVTEGVMVNDFRDVGEKLMELRAHGMRIALDDFGAGYSSVGYLQKLTFDRIKIDRAITNRIEFGRLEQGIAQGTVIMARGMSASVIAEGVETEAQAKILQLTGCSAFQGFFFHRPLSVAQFDKVLADQKAHGVITINAEELDVA